VRPPSFLLPALLLLAGCGGPKRVSVEAFQREYDLRNHQTVTASEYLGERDGRAYLLRKRMPLLGRRWKEEVWLVDTADLPPAFLERLRQESENRQFDPAQ
jgi:hypothetical protein